MDDGRSVVDPLGSKLLHVLIHLRRPSAKFIHAHVYPFIIVVSAKSPTRSCSRITAY
jgi:hypothetical protein